MVGADVLGEGPNVLLLPALSSIATRQEMRPLAERLKHQFRCTMVDWPGFGAPIPLGSALSPSVLDAFVEALPADADLRTPIVAIAAGHGAGYLLKDARRAPGRYSRLILIAPTWRGPLPTMTRGKRPAFCLRVRQVLDAPAIGPAVFAANLSRPVVAWMMREHVYADAGNVTPAVLAAKRAVAARPGARHATAAFVSGGLDPVKTRAEFLALIDAETPPVLMLRPRDAPSRSAAEMDALAASERVEVTEVPGALAPHEEHPDAVASAILSVIDRGAPG